MSITTTNAKIQLSLEGVQQVESGLARVQSVAGGAARALAGIAGGVFSAAAFRDWIQGAIDAADQTDELTQKTGLLAEQVAGLKLAFQFGSVGDQFGAAMARLAKEVAGGNKAFEAMGVATTDAQGKLRGVRDVFAEVSDKFAGYEDGIGKTALAMEIFGKSGAEMIVVLNGGSASLDEFDKKARELGLTIDGETAAAAAKFNDELDIMSLRLDGVAVAMAGPLVTSLNELIAKFQEGSREGNSFMSTVWQIYSDNVSKVYGGQAANPYTDTRVELERLNLALASGKLNVMQTLALEEKRAELAKKMSAYLGGSGGAGRGSINPELVKGVAPIVPRSDPKPTKAPKAPKADRDEFADLLNRVSMKDLGLDPSFYKDLETLYAGYQKGRVGVDEYRTAVEALVVSQKFAQDQARAREQSLATEAELLTIVTAKEREWADQVAKRNQSAQQMVDQIQFETSLLGLNSEERERAVSLRELERLGIEKGTEAYVKYGAALEKAMLDRQQREKTLQMWSDVNSAAESAFMDIALNGEDAFKRIGESIKREVIQMLYEMTVRKWIFQIAGVSTGGGGGVDWMSLASKAYDYYAGGSAGSAVGSAASAAGSSYAAASVSDAAMVSTGSSTAAGGSSSAMMGYMSYAALIAAAVMIAQNLYAKGYTRAAIGEGGSETARFGQYSSYTTDPNTQRAGAMQNSPAMLMTNDMRKFNDMLGMSEQWADILSGTTRMATLVGRKLSAYGYQADIAGGDSETSGFARYKGVLRSNKTVKADVDPRDAAAFDAVVESTIEGSKAMARAMGYSDEAINAYTGSLKVNFKGAKTAEEQSQRMAEAMNNLNFELLKTAAGGKLAREEFKAMMEGIQKDIEGAGISTAGITDIMTGGILNGLSGEEIGAQLSQMILGGIVNTFAQQAFAPVAQAMMTQIITPIFTAIAAGIPISQAVSKASIEGMLNMANQAMEALNAIFNSAEMRAFFASLSEMFAGIGGSVGGVKIPKIPNIKPIDPGPDETKREREQLEREILRLEDNTVELRRRELLDLKPSNRALQERIWALEDEKEALEKVTELQDAWTDLTGSIEDEIKRLRGIVAGESAAGLAYLQAQFAITTGQARAMDQDAAGRLPDLSSQLADLYLETSGSRNEYQRRVNSLAASLEETNRITRATAGIGADNAQKVEDKALAQKIELLQKTVEVLQKSMEANTKAAESASKALSGSFNGGALRTVPA